MYFNVRGVGFKFLWNEKYRKHIFEGRELEAEEFNKLSETFADYDPMENACHAVGQFVGTDTAEVAAEPEVEPDLTLSERREFIQTIADLEAKLKAKHGGRPKKVQPTKP
jgi:hypothetical protein